MARFQAHSMAVTIQRLEQQHNCRILVAPDDAALLVWSPRTPPDNTLPMVRHSRLFVYFSLVCYLWIARGHKLATGRILFRSWVLLQFQRGACMFIVK